MDKKEEGKLEKIAFREHLITDQGNGGSYCTNCKCDLGSDPCKNYDTCPGCGYKLVNGEIHPYSFGGSDF